MRSLCLNSICCHHGLQAHRFGYQYNLDDQIRCSALWTNKLDGCRHVFMIRIRIICVEKSYLKSIRKKNAGIKVFNLHKIWQLPRNHRDFCWTLLNAKLKGFKLTSLMCSNNLSRLIRYVKVTNCPKAHALAYCF